MNARIKVLLTAAILGAAVGTAYPFVDLALACRAPESEACVWGKAYLPLSLGISIPIIGGVVAAVAYAFMTWRNREAGKKMMTSNNTYMDSSRKYQARPVISFVAEDRGTVVGHILFSPVSLVGHPPLKLMGLAPMAVSGRAPEQGHRLRARTRGTSAPRRARRRQVGHDPIPSHLSGTPMLQAGNHSPTVAGGRPNRD